MTVSYPMYPQDEWVAPEFEDIDESLPVPTFAESRPIADLLGIRTQECWDWYANSMTRTELFQKVTDAHRKLIEKLRN